MQRKELLNELFESKGIGRTDANMSTYEWRNVGPLGVCLNVDNISLAQ